MDRSHGGFAAINKPAVSVYRNRVDLNDLTRIPEITAAGGTSVAHLKELSKGLEYWSLEDPAALSARAQHRKVSTQSLSLNNRCVRGWLYRNRLRAGIEYRLSRNLSR